ncbi:hypothetical protein PVAP13_1NG202938 [Panicum virgatum]|uniref:Uncharacterized protein n=1 Tax=Panicum virgatum TaxID=38727 RepID=A0A8T0WX33_PANVG|nr:hypothetical protein PVAP13_1NG202938 [Panicum virgatum]
MAGSRHRGTASPSALAIHFEAAHPCAGSPGNRHQLAALPLHQGTMSQSSDALRRRRRRHGLRHRRRKDADFSRQAEDGARVLDHHEEEMASKPPWATTPAKS